MNGAVTIVTGAGSGIGRATALRFGREGARVLAADIDGDAAQETAELAEGTVRAAALDVCDQQAVVAMLDLCEQELGSRGVAVLQARHRPG